MQKLLICDLETTSKDAGMAEIKVFSAYDPTLDKYYIYKWGDLTLAKCYELFNEYEYIITFNGTRYDMPILVRHGMPLPKKHIDIYQIIKYTRKTLMPKITEYSLDALSQQLLGIKIKGEIDYEIFKKDTWTDKEQQEIIIYCKKDLDATWKLWQYLQDRFKIFGQYLTIKDRESYKHITTPLTTYAYKVICHNAGVPELYDEHPKIRDYPKPIITTPKQKITTEQIALLRMPYYYTHLVIQFNLLSWHCKCCPPERREGKFHGKNYYKIKGYYCQKTQGPIETFLKKLYDESHTPESQILAKVIFNNLYKIMSNATYYTMYNPWAVMDMVTLARQQLSIILKTFKEKDYMVIYIEEDKIFVRINESQSLTEVLHLKEKALDALKSKMSFPSKTFHIELLDTLRYMEFYTEGFAKKKYLYINNDGFINTKGLNDQEVDEVLRHVGGVV